MYKLLLTLMILFSATIARSQIVAGIKAGVTPARQVESAHLIVNRTDPINSYTFNTQSSNQGIQAGAFVQIPLNDHFFTEHSVLYTQTNMDYFVRCLEHAFLEGGERVFSERQHRLSVPTSIGVHLGKIDVKSGLVANFVLGESSELSQLEGFYRKKDVVLLGMHSAITLNLPSIAFELGYEIDFQNFGHNRYINEQYLELSNAPRRFVTSVAYKF